jgi:hypothetical protein
MRRIPSENFSNNPLERIVAFLDNGLDGSCGEETTGRFLSDDCGELVLLRKRHNHLRGARCVAVHEEIDPPVKWSLAQPLGLKHNGFRHHCRSKLQGKPPEGFR